MLFEFAVATTIYLGRFIPGDILEYNGVEVWKQADRTAKCYDWFEQYLEKNYDRNKDYSEGIFLGNFSMSLSEATEKKYEYIFNKLQLKAGMRVLDAGCGTGKWMKYLKDRGVDVVGMTLSEEQAKVVRQKDLDVRVADYRVKNEEFLGSFDRITALGSSEHVCTSLGYLNGDATERCNQTRIDTWKLLKEYLKPDGKLYITVLTKNEKRAWSKWDYMQSYVLERHYGGFYSSMDDIANEVVPKTGFRLTDLQDKTQDYHWSSVRDPDHFGHWTVKWAEDPHAKVNHLMSDIFMDAHIAHRWGYYALDTWMWQFGGYQDTPLTDEQVKNAPVQLKYFMLEN
jgi:cyclopropane fatty-acyl-phospholipid synthase-like methyltransferase